MRATKTFLIFSLLIFLVSCSERKVSYNEEIKPLINKKCISCHGGVKRNGGFSLLFRSEALDTTESDKPAIIPGNALASEMFVRLTHADPEERMPYKEEPLTEEEIELIRRWIDQGAEWETHWAYRPPVRKEKPTFLTAFFGKEGAFLKNRIDEFTLERMRSKGFDPAPQAEKEVLMRRLYLDLTGLPPSQEEVKKFLEEDDAQAYERLVDTLLQRPAFGEKWASWWLDMARYSDTKGYEKDASRSIWRYRDYVIRSFNEDKPFDRFTIEQLAGDLLPEPTDEQYVATAFHRNTMSNDEGGTDDEEFRVASVIDRVNTTFQVWQSTTFSCVQCHSHPYDPFRHDEYYKVYAFFNNTRDEDTEGDFPKLRHYEVVDKKALDDLLSWTKREQPEKVDAVKLFLRTLEPKMHPHRCDEFVNGSLLDNKWIGIRHGGRCRVAAVNLKDKEYLMMNYWTSQQGGRFEISIDRPNGPILASGNLKPTKGSEAVYFKLDRRVLGNGPDVRNLYWKFFNSRIPADQAVCGIEWFVFQEAWPLGNKVLTDGYMKLVNSRPPQTPIMVENKAEYRRATRVFERGSWLVQGAEVQPAIPSLLTVSGKNFMSDRLGFAQWLVDPANPLTSRTVVNRFWEQLFGQGLVTTLEDFGSQGELPSHPELLDYLAVQFSDEYQWSIKKILKEMVLSGTYRQDSRIRDDRDPSNTWLARGPRVRLTAEQLRDQALSVSGLLSKKMYGKSVMPYQPENVWQTVYSGESWVLSEGEDRYRRAIYTFSKRTSPYPSAMVFDGSSREVCVVQRVRTNTPLQALVTMNDPVFIEAAVALAQTQAPNIPVKESIKAMYRSAVFRDLSKEKLVALVQLYIESYEKFQRNKTSAEALMGCSSADPSTAALSVVALAVLNLDEFLTKE
ncbi:MAG: PSD1 and planctomycete cytochrome C domain-containing protein [Cyclobacteriaceae bacterium]